jgi:hypothetical protein
VIGQIETVFQQAPAAWRGVIAGRRVSAQWLLVLWVPVGIVIGKSYGLWAGSVSGMAVGTVAGVVDGIRNRGVIRRRHPVVNAVARPATITTKVQVHPPTVVAGLSSEDTPDQ